MKAKLPNNKKQEDGAKKGKSSDGLVQLYFREFIKLKPTVLDVSPHRPATEKHRQNSACSASQPGTLLPEGLRGR